MKHTFDTVDQKVAEVEFFLARMSEIHFDPFAFNCYFSAYLSAARTVTLALQQFKHIAGFEEWYQAHRQRLATDAIAKFFLDTRNDHVHGGPYPISGGSISRGRARYNLQSSDKSSEIIHDAVSAARDHFLLLLEIVYDAYVKLGVHIDPQQYYTKEHLRSVGRTIDEAEVEVCGWICTSLIAEGFDDDDRWHELRSRVGGCSINHLFYSYLGKPTPQPIEPEHFSDFEYSPQERVWEWTPAGFKSLRDYREMFPSRSPDVS